MDLWQEDPAWGSRLDVLRFRRSPLRLAGWTATVLGLLACVPVVDRSTPESSPGLSSSAFDIQLETDGARTAVHVFDPDRTLLVARPAAATEVAAAIELLSANDIVAFRGAADDTVIVGCLVTPCDQQAALTVVARSITVELPPRPGCDAMAITRVVSLRFADPARAALVSPCLIPATLLPEPEPRTPVPPPPTEEDR
jgi:hypothetical protein